jgi:hypothetical protein
VSDERGQGTLELLLALGLLVALLVGALSLGQGYSARHALDNATAIAARQIALNPGAWGDALKGVGLAVAASLWGGAADEVSCAVYDSGGALVDPTYLPFASRFSVTCSAPFQAQISFVPTSPRTLTVTHYEVMERYP